MAIELPINFEEAWPWMRGFRRIVRTVAEPRLTGCDLFSASDFSGSHKGSKFNVYSFLLIDPERSAAFFRRISLVRATFLGGRRMSFKALNDKQRQAALVPFLEASERLHGVCCSIAVTKTYPYMATAPSTATSMTNTMNLEGRWNKDVFETAMRAVMLWSVLVSEVGNGMQNITWVLDEDEIAANDLRHTDLLQLSGRIGQHFIRRQMGGLCVCTTASEGTDIRFEDFSAVTDLAAGAFCEAVNRWARSPENQTDAEGRYELTDHSGKCDLINDWFFYPSTSLRRVAVLILKQANPPTV